MHDKLILEALDKLDNNQFPQNAISHKQLNILLNKAKKDTSSIETTENDEFYENQEFKILTKDWTKTSQKILNILNKKNQFSTKNKSPKSLMAFGAMGAHISMALQALKAAEYE